MTMLMNIRPVWFWSFKCLFVNGIQLTVYTMRYTGNTEEMRSIK